MTIKQPLPNKFQLRDSEARLQQHLTAMDNSRQKAIKAYKDAIDYLNECTANLRDSLEKRNTLLNKPESNKSLNIFQTLTGSSKNNTKQEIDSFNKAITHWEHEIAQIQQFIKEEKLSEFIKQSEASYKEQRDIYQELAHAIKPYI